MIYRFGSFALDASARELRRDNERVDVEPKAFELLLYLAEHRERAVSKDELLNVLWPRQIVTETALSRCVMKARRAVDDDADRQCTIRTLHGHGYRFVAILAPADADAEAAAVTDEAPAAASSRAGAPVTARDPRPRRYAVIALVAFLLTGIGVLLWQNSRVSAPGLLAVLPIADRTGEAELRWASVGIMSLLARMLEDGGIDVVADRQVLDAVEDGALDVPPDDREFERLRRRTEASTLLHTALEKQGGLYRLVAVLVQADGRHVRRIIVGESPATLAADLAGVVTGLLHGSAVPDDERFSKVSTDPFVNELYARALDLELQGKLQEARDMFRLASIEAPELFWLRYEIALCTRDLREWESAEAQFAVLYEEASAGADARALVVTLNSRGILRLNRNDYLAAEADFLQALEIATERSRQDERTTVLTNLGLINTRLGRPEDAARYYEQALAEIEAAGRTASGFVLNNYAGLLMEGGNLRSARSYSERAVETFRLHGQRRYEAPALNRLARILRRQGEFDGALARHEQALAIYRDLGDVPGELSVLSALTSVYRANGNLTRAMHNAADVLARAGDTGDDLLLADAWMQSAYVETDFARHASAIAYFESADRFYATVGDAAGMRAARTGIALAEMKSGNVDRATDRARDLLQTAVADQNAAAEAGARWLLGRLAENRGDTLVAAGEYGSALDYARTSADQDMLVAAALSLAELRLAAGDVNAAAELVEEARDTGSAEIAFLRLDARLARAQGRTRDAREILMQLRRRAGEAWNDEDDALLSQLSP